MLKSKSQSMQAPLALQARTYYSFPNTKQTYLQNNTARTGVQTTLFKQTKQPKQSKRKLRRSKNNTTCAWNNKNEVSRQTWAFYWWRRGCLGHPQALTLVPLGYLLGWHHGGIPKLELLSILHLIASFSLYTWNFSFIQNFTQSSLATLVYSKDNRPLGLALKQQKFH